MLNNYFTIREISKYLNENISGYIINEIYTQEKNKLLIKIFNELGGDSKVLEYSIERGKNYLLLKDYFLKAKKNYANLFEKAYGKKILEINLYNDDRIIRFKLENELELLFTFFSNKANCFLVVENKIINSFKDKSEYFQKEISEVIPAKEKIIDDDGVNISLNKFIRHGDRIYGDLYAKEVLYITKLSGEETVDEQKKKIIKQEFDKVNNKLNNSKYFLYSKNDVLYISLIKLYQLHNFEIKEFKDINTLIFEYVKLKSRADKIAAIKQIRISELKQKFLNIKKKIEGLKKQIIFCEDSNNLKKAGDIILQNLNVIKKGDKKFFYKTEDGKEIEIKLKENLSPVENAQNHFDKYKKQKNSGDVLKSKIVNLEKEKIKVESEIEKVNKLEDYKSLIKEEKKSEENTKDETSRFRKFKLNDKYEVWVGKDSASNDLLTTKYTAQNDLWFHVRGASGSHTILKVNNKKVDIAKEVIHIAASIAAYYSKARNASSVPVAYSEKKYVKKKKGFKEGSVVMEREKVIFVKPSLPDGI